MVILLEATARYGKTTTANHLKIVLNGAIVIDQPRCETQEQIDAFCRLCLEYSECGDVIVTDAGDLLVQSNGKILDIADLVLVGRMHDLTSIDMLGLNAEEVFRLMKGEWINAKESNRLSSQMKDDIFVSLVTMKRVIQDYKDIHEEK